MRMKKFGGNILFLDRVNINTDEIIPAKYLNEVRKEDLRPFLLEDLKLEGFDRATALAAARVIITRANFGCGSSREHAPWALETNGITVVIAESFARIFRQNMFNGGMLAIELPKADLGRLFAFAGSPAAAAVDLTASRITVNSGQRSETIAFTLAPFDRALVESGGWVDFADGKY
jgi:3-isopropylmalate/(R)-2-methylmalate dehydratase small subunit